MKIVRLVCCLCLLLVTLMAVALPGVAAAQDEEEFTVEEKIELSPVYPTIKAIAGGSFEFEMEFLYIGTESKVFDLTATAPPQWDVYMTPPYEKEKKISSLTLSPGYSFGDKIRVVAEAPFWPLPDPGEYPIVFEASSGDVKNSVELTAIIEAKYILDVVPVSERYNVTAESGKETTYSVNIQNIGTDDIDNIKFTKSHPEGWEITTPDKIDTVAAFDMQTVDITIKPPAKTIAGDYVISLRASGVQASADEIQVRVTVETPTVWGWVGVAIIVIVVVGLIIIFMRFSRR